MTQGAHYELAIDDMIAHIKADTGIIQPWRNDAIAQLRRAKAFIRMGVTSTNRTDLPSAPEEHDKPPVMEFDGPLTCVCTPGMPARKDCAVHGMTLK